MPIDICIPQNNEAELLVRARELSYDFIVFLYQVKTRAELLKKKSEIKNLKSDLKIYVGTFLLTNKASDLGKLQNLYLDSDLIAVQTFDENVVRSAASNPRVDVIFGITTSHGRDHFEYRRSNLNTIIVNIMSEHKISYGLSFAHLLAGKGEGKAISYALAKILGREMQNIRFARRKIPIIAASFAREPWQMRLPENLSAVSRVLGLNFPQSKAAVSAAIENILKRKEQRRSKEFVRPGVKIVSN